MQLLENAVLLQNCITFWQITWVPTVDVEFNIELLTIVIIYISLSICILHIFSVVEDFIY